MQAPADKRPKLDVIELKGTGSGMPNQFTRYEFSHTNRLPLHGRNAEEGNRWAEPHHSQTLPVQSGWPLAGKWHQDDNEYAEDRYVIGARPQNWQNEHFNSPHRQDNRMPYNHPLGGHRRGKMPIGRPNAPQLRYTCDRRLMDLVYIDKDVYVVQHVERRDMYEEGEQHRYARAPIRYVSNQHVVVNAPPLLPTFAKTHPAYPQASTKPMRAPAHDKGHQPASTPNFGEDVYNFESFILESSATRNIPNAEDGVLLQTAPTPVDVSVNTSTYSTTPSYPKLSNFLINSNAINFNSNQS